MCIHGVQIDTEGGMDVRDCIALHEIPSFTTSMDLFNSWSRVYFPRDVTTRHNHLVLWIRLDIKRARQRHLRKERRPQLPSFKIFQSSSTYLSIQDLPPKPMPNPLLIPNPSLTIPPRLIPIHPRKTIKLHLWTLILPLQSPSLQRNVIIMPE